MFFDSAKEIPQIASKISTGVFVMPVTEKCEIKNAIVLQPEEKSVITIDQVREMLGRLAMKQVSDLYIIIRPADAMNDEAANALLKNLEEPKDKVHFVLITENPSKLLPTVLSRAAVYFLRSTAPLDADIKADAKVKDAAKKLITAKPQDLPALAEELHKKKDNRKYTLEVLAVAIEMLYKSYYKTDKMVFINKLPKFLKTYEAIAANGNIKLQLVAGLM